MVDAEEELINLNNSLDYGVFFKLYGCFKLLVVLLRKYDVLIYQKKHNICSKSIKEGTTNCRT